jgi:hypothetical protein
MVTRSRRGFVRIADRYLPAQPIKNLYGVPATMAY